MGSITSPPPIPMDLPVDPLVQSLVGLVGGINNLDEAVRAAYKQGPVQMQDYGLSSGKKFLQLATGLLRWVPTETIAAKDIYYIICIFHFIFEQPPISRMVTSLDPSSLGAPLSPVSQWIVAFSCKMGEFMDTKESLPRAALDGFWSSDKWNMFESEVPPGDFKTFNQLFARRLKPGCRPIASPADDNVIVSAADSMFDAALPVDGKGVLTVKNLDWPIKDLLKNSDYANEFAGGTCVHTELYLTDYHRVHAPVSGKVLEAKVIQGQARGHVRLTRSLGRVTLDMPRGWQAEDAQEVKMIEAGLMPNHGGFHCLQTRGCIIIDNPVVGKVAVLPVGMAHVSSVKLCVQGVDDVAARGLPCEVAKGDELGYFQFGGSDMILIFQSDPGVDVSTLRRGQQYNFGEPIGTVKRR